MKPGVWELMQYCWITDHFERPDVDFLARVIVGGDTALVMGYDLVFPSSAPSDSSSTTLSGNTDGSVSGEPTKSEGLNVGEPPLRAIDEGNPLAVPNSAGELSGPLEQTPLHPLVQSYLSSIGDTQAPVAGPVEFNFPPSCAVDDINEPTSSRSAICPKSPQIPFRELGRFPSAYFYPQHERQQSTRLSESTSGSPFQRVPDNTSDSPYQPHSREKSEEVRRSSASFRPDRVKHRRRSTSVSSKALSSPATNASASPGSLFGSPYYHVSSVHSKSSSPYSGSILDSPFSIISKSSV